MRLFLTFFVQLGVGGLLLLGILDSSFLFLPVGNDLLLVVLTARHHENAAVYVIAAALGSAIGVLLLDAVCRKGGEEGLKRVLSPKRLAYAKTKVKSHAAIMVLLATLAPPPFPFTAIVATASAFQYPRLGLLGLVIAGRLMRFAIEAWAAIHYGRHILAIMRAPEFRWAIIGFAAICVAGSVLSVMKWVRRPTPA